MFDLQQSSKSEQERRLSQDYRLPHCLSIALDVDIRQAHALSILTALFALGLLTLAQMAASSPGSGSAWNALGFFTYSAIILNLTGTYICLIHKKMCYDLPHRAQQAVLLDRNSWAAKIAVDGDELPEELLSSHYDLLEAFGMSKHYMGIDTAVLSTVVILGFLYTFIALVIWLWVSESYVSVGVTVFTAVPALVCAILVLCVGMDGEGWE